jgi:hypothetical protein
MTTPRPGQQDRSDDTAGDICPLTDLLRSACSHCTGRGEELPPDPARSGPWITARYPGRCSGCTEPVTPGDRIRGDGDGGWLCEDCGSQEDRS